MDINTLNKEHIPLSAKIYKVLEEKILSGEYAPKSVITELKICKELSVSRTPVRDAIRMLESAGLVENIPNKCTIIRGISQKDVCDIYEMRIALEGLATRWAAENMPEADISKMKELLELSEFYSMRRDDSHLTAADSDFHKLIYENCSSRIMENVFANFHKYIETAKCKSFKNEIRTGLALSEHKAIYEAICEKEYDRVQELAVVHVKNAYNNFLLGITDEKSR